MRKAGSIRILTEEQVRSLIDPVAALDAVRNALDAFAAGRANQPPPWHLELPAVDGEIHVKGAHIEGDARLAIKLATGFFGNPVKGLASSGGFSVVLSAETGAIEAVLADNGYLTDLRTGLAGAAASDVLARREVETVAVVGSGTQARCQLQSLLLVRNPLRVLIAARRHASAEDLAREAQMWSGWSVEVSPSIEDAVRQADIVVTTTPSHSPIVFGDWLKTGTHITAVGSDSHGKRELDSVVFDRASHVVADDPEQCRIRGELQYVGPETLDVAALGDLIAGRCSGRTSDDDITVADLIGIGAEDAAVATLVAQRASRG